MCRPSCLSSSQGPFVIGQPDHSLSEGNAEIMGVVELCSGERRTPEVCTSLEAWLAGAYGAEVGIVQVAVGQVSPAQVRVVEVGAPKICATEIGVLQACSPKISPRQIETADLRGIAAVAGQRRPAQRGHGGLRVGSS